MKAKTIFVCSSCGYESPKWLGKCPSCNEWNSFYEEKVAIQTGSGKQTEKKSVTPKSLNEVVSVSWAFGRP